jgi:hypothetical protein
MANQYRLKIVRGDQEFEVEGDKVFVQKMADRFALEFGHTPIRTAGAGKARGPATEAAKGSKTAKQLSVREFIQKLNLKKHTDIALAFGFFLEHSLGKASFTPADINNLYYEAKLEPSNTSQACILNIRRSFMMESKKAGAQAGGRKSYTLTQSGDAFIEKKLAAAPE